MMRAAPFALLLAACGSAAPKPPPQATPSPELLQELPPRRVHPEQCSLVLLTRAEPARRIVLALDNPAVALVQTGGRVLELPRVATSGEARLGHAERQVYRSADGELAADIRFAPAPGEQAGYAIRSASVSFTPPSGDNVIVPAVGVLACGPASPMATELPR
jgi:hypothetical protein